MIKKLLAYISAGVVTGALFIGATAIPAGALMQKLQTYQPTLVCDATTLTNCAPVSPTNGLAVDVKTISATPTGQQTAANSDSVVLCSTGNGCIVPVQYNSSTTTMQSSASANGNGTVLAVDGYSTALVTVNCSSCAGGTQVIFEAQNDGTNFSVINAIKLGTSQIANSTTTAGFTFWRIPVSGAKQLRTRIASYSAGTITVTGTAIAANFSPLVTARASNTLKRYISVGTSEDKSQVTASPGVLVGISARNSHATNNAYIKCTDATAASTTPGSTTIFYEMLVPAGPSGFVDADINAEFSTALTCYIVTGKANNDVAEVAADDVSYNLRYRN